MSFETLCRILGTLYRTSDILKYQLFDMLYRFSDLSKHRTIYRISDNQNNTNISKSRIFETSHPIFETLYCTSDISKYQFVDMLYRISNIEFSILVYQVLCIEFPIYRKNRSSIISNFRYIEISKNNRLMSYAFRSPSPGNTGSFPLTPPPLTRLEHSKGESTLSLIHI